MADMNLQLTRELFEAQHILVRAVTHLLAARATEQDLAEIEAAIRAVDAAEESHDPAAVAEKNSLLHISETRLTGNSYLLSMAERVYTHLQRLAFLSFGGAGGVGGEENTNALMDHYRHVHDDHWAYLEALRTRDTAAAEKVAIQHVERFQARVKKYLETNAVEGLDFTGLTPTSLPNA